MSALRPSVRPMGHVPSLHQLSALLVAKVSFEPDGALEESRPPSPAWWYDTATSTWESGNFLLHGSCLGERRAGGPFRRSGVRRGGSRRPWRLRSTEAPRDGRISHNRARSALSGPLPCHSARKRPHRLALQRRPSRI